MSALIGKNLHDRGIHYVNERLENGDVLSKAVRAARGPVTSAFAPLPTEFDPTSLTNLSYSGPTTLKASIEWLVPEMRKTCREKSRFLILVEDAWFKPSDMDENDKQWYFQLSEDDCLTYALEGDQLTETSLFDLFMIIHNVRFTGFVVEMAPLADVPVGGFAARDIAKHVTQVLAVAFDGDGLILSDWA